MDKIKENGKAIWTLVVTLLINMVVSFLQNDQPWPQTQDDWVRYVATTLGATLTAYGVRNKITQDQLDKGKQKGTVLGDAVAVPTAQAIPSPPVVVAPSEQPTVTAHPIQQQSEPEPPSSPYPFGQSDDTAESSGNATVDDIIAEYQLKHHRTDQ